MASRTLLPVHSSGRPAPAIERPGDSLEAHGRVGTLLDDIAALSQLVAIAADPTLNTQHQPNDDALPRVMWIIERMATDARAALQQLVQREPAATGLGGAVGGVR
jgi:hypothetical protein